MNPRMTTRRVRFSFDERKATAAAGLLLKLAGGEMDYLPLIKLLYYADRDSLDRLGRPIIGDRYYRMRHGPVLSRVFDLIKSAYLGHPIPGPWSEHIGASGRFSVKLKAETDIGVLSRHEIEIIEEVFNRYPWSDKWALRDATHRLPEWKDPGGSSAEISPEELLKCLGKGEDEIEEIAQNAAEKAHFDSIFGT